MLCEPDAPTTVLPVSPLDVKRLDTSVLITRCAEETRRYRERIPYTELYGFELFRRALVEQDQRAWEGLFTCYGQIVRGWASSGAGDPDAVEVLVTAAFEQLWMAVDAAKFARFADLRSLLQYLKMCVTTAVLDRRRAAARRAHDVALQESNGDELAARDDVEGQALDAADRRAFWEAIRHQLADSQELLLVRLSFVEGIPPREICRREPAHFPSVNDVYRIKRNVLDRLRRSPEVLAMASQRGDGSGLSSAHARRVER